MYAYDELLRLTGETISGHPGRNGSIGYTLDAVGNRLTRTSTVAGVANQTFTYDANDRIEGEGHDANGNTLTSTQRLDATGAETLHLPTADQYDSENRLIARTAPQSVQIVYDGDGHKVREVVNGYTISYLVDEQNPTGYAQVVEEKQNGVVLRTYTYGHDLLAQDERNGGGSWSDTYFGYDGHGNVRLLTDATGQITDTYVYDAFGIALETTGSTFNRYRYTGEAYDSALGLQYLRARLLNSSSGRFCTMDPFAGIHINPLTLHKYAYAHASPSTAVDPSGLFVSGAETSIASGIVSNLRTAGAPAATSIYWNSVGSLTNSITRIAILSAFAYTRVPTNQSAPLEANGNSHFGEMHHCVEYAKEAARKSNSRLTYIAYRGVPGAVNPNRAPENGIFAKRGVLVKLGGNVSNNAFHVGVVNLNRVSDNNIVGISIAEWIQNYEVVAPRTSGPYMTLDQAEMAGFGQIKAFSARSPTSQTDTIWETGG